MISRTWPLLALLSTGMAFEALKPHPKAVPNIHPPGEVDRPEMVKFIVADPAALPGIVVDETNAELVGEWTVHKGRSVFSHTPGDPIDVSDEIGLARSPRNSVNVIF